MSHNRNKDMSMLYENLRELNDITRSLQREMSSKSTILANGLAACKSCQRNVPATSASKR